MEFVNFNKFRNKVNFIMDFNLDFNLEVIIDCVSFTPKYYLNVCFTYEVDYPIEKLLLIILIK